MPRHQLHYAHGATRNIPRAERPVHHRHTRRRFGGRQPLCGIGVTSLIRLTSRPAACRERIAASRPAPGPFTITSTVLMPCSMAARAAASAAICAAYGVLLREPLNPTFPALAQEIVFPCGSVIVTIVLLNVDRMWAMPLSTFFRSRRFVRTVFFALAIYGCPPFSLLLLVRDGAARSLAGPGVRLRALAADRQSLAVANAAVAADFHEPLDVHGHFPAQVAFHLHVLLDAVAQPAHFVFRQVAHAGIRADAGFRQDALAGRFSDAVNVGQADFHPFFAGKVNTSNACHLRQPPPSALFLLVLRIFTNDHHVALAADDLAFFADRFDRRSYLHREPSCRPDVLSPLTSDT